MMMYYKNMTETAKTLNENIRLYLDSTQNQTDTTTFGEKLRSDAKQFWTDMFEFM